MAWFANSFGDQSVYQVIIQTGDGSMCLCIVAPLLTANSSMDGISRPYSLLQARWRVLASGFACFAAFWYISPAGE